MKLSLKSFVIQVSCETSSLEKVSNDVMGRLLICKNIERSWNSSYDTAKAAINIAQAQIIYSHKNNFSLIRLGFVSPFTTWFPNAALHLVTFVAIGVISKSYQYTVSAMSINQT